MSKKALNFYLVLLASLILFALSPFAFLGGLLVALLLVVPFGFLLKALGFEVKGQTFDEYLAIAFFAVSLVLAVTALWQFYRAASAWDAKEFESGRASIASGATLITLPILVYLFYHALPGIT
ncbi:hypothetical protein [Altererythrobacter lutimaris]|uniref:Uncharacterized protein n=1 Tax=Altererythrobacter lutimaris TaxID=2743979 RepID=A0A850H342_9SPHN|nr:hypothetical protein [Altererythrobacter lutimaris]NVE93567.1 hypothetical protein [Altererythrobacter lutimaris]